MTAEWQEDVKIETWAAVLREQINEVVSAELDVEEDLRSVKHQAARQQPMERAKPRNTHLESETDLWLSANHVGENTIISVSGELDTYTSPRLRELLFDMVRNGHARLIIELNQVVFLDSGALGILVGALKNTLRHGGGTLIVCQAESIRKLFRITNLNQPLPVLDSVEEACAAMDAIIPELARREDLSE